MTAVLTLIVSAYSLSRKRDTEGPEAEIAAFDDPRALRRHNARMGAAIIAAVLVTCGVLAVVQDGYYHSQSSISHLYEVTVIGPENETYTVMCPIPIDRDGGYYEAFVEETAVREGSAGIALVETEHGPALRITGQGAIGLEWSASWYIDGERFLNLSMTEGLDWADYGEGADAWSWIYADRAGVSIELHHRFSLTERSTWAFASYAAYDYDLTAQPETDGWHSAGVEYSVMMS